MYVCTYFREAAEPLTTARSKQTSQPSALVFKHAGNYSRSNCEVAQRSDAIPGKVSRGSHRHRHRQLLHSLRPERTTKMFFSENIDTAFSWEGEGRQQRSERRGFS